MPKLAALRVAFSTAAALQYSLRGQQTSWYKAGAHSSPLLPVSDPGDTAFNECSSCLKGSLHILLPTYFTRACGKQDAAVSTWLLCTLCC